MGGVRFPSSGAIPLCCSTEGRPLSLEIVPPPMAQEAALGLGIDP